MMRGFLASALTVALAGASLSCTEEIESRPAETEASAAPASSSPRPEARGAPRAYSAHLYSERDADVYSRLDGPGSAGGVPVISIEVEVGDRVEVDEVLAVLDDQEARLSVAAARPPYESAVAEFERLKRLHGQNAASEAELERARYEKQSKKAALDRAELRLRRTRVRAPFGGVVSDRYVGVGQLVTREVPLFRVTAPVPLRARLLVPEGRAEQLNRGAEVTVEGVDGDTAAARAVIVAPTIDAASGTREVIVQLVDPRGFQPGASVTVRPRGAPAPAAGAGR